MAAFGSIAMIFTSRIKQLASENASPGANIRDRFVSRQSSLLKPVL